MASNMVSESYIWKNELKKEVKRFKKFVSKFDWSSEDADLADFKALKVEKFFFVSAFIVRKLNESKKLSDQFNALEITVAAFERINMYKRFRFRFIHDELNKFCNCSGGVA